MASRHFCFAVATAPPEPVVVVEAGADEFDGEEEVLELPHALSVITAATSTPRSGVRKRIMPPSSRMRPRPVAWSDQPRVPPPPSMPVVSLEPIGDVQGKDEPDEISGAIHRFSSLQ